MSLIFRKARVHGLTDPRLLWVGGGGGESRLAGGAGPGGGLAGGAGGGRARQTHSAADVSGLAGLVVFISPTPGCSQTPGQI